MRLIAGGITSCVILALAMTSAGRSGDQPAAVLAAEGWVKLVDDGRYAESWKEAAEYFRSMVKQNQWAEAIKEVRRSLGAVISRRQTVAEFATALPGAPDGEYVVIQFATSFENKAAAVETITPMLDKDGQWRVAGYFIK